MRSRTVSTRALQVGILVLLLVSAAQVLWWILDQSRRTAELEERLTSIYSDDIRIAEELLRPGTGSGTLEELFPHLMLDEDGSVVVRPEILASLNRDRARWLNQYRWEGAFFLLVLTVSMAVVWRALHQESLLRRRHQNFMAAVSHELKSPLASLQLSVETLGLRELPRQRVEELTERMASDLGRMQDMISKILNTSRLEDRRVALRPRSVELATAVSGAVRELEGRAYQAGARIEIELDSKLRIHADPGAVETVLRNVLDNSLKSVEANGGGTIRLGAERERDLVRLSITDDGIGFAPEEAHHLFEKFYRPGDEMRRGGRGQGLGLYIVRRLVELGGGRAEASSPGQGRGATLDLWWPAAEEAP